VFEPVHDPLPVKTDTGETAIQFEKALGTPAALWLAREARYREWLARNDDRCRPGSRT
jgi:plasmid maintenance system antidote protein VapI